MLVVTALLEQESEDQSYEKHSSIRPAASTGHSVSTSQRRQVYSVSVRLSPAAAGYCSFMINQEVLINQT